MVLYLANSRIQFALYAVAGLSTLITDLESGAARVSWTGFGVTGTPNEQTPAP